MLYLNILISFFLISQAYSGSMESVFGGSSSSKSSSSSRSRAVFGSFQSDDSLSSNTEQKSSSAFGVQHTSTEKSSLKKVFSDKVKADSSNKTVASQNFSKHGSKTVYVGGTESFIFPTKKRLITSYYGWRSGKRFHDGIDIGGELKTPIYASARGIVIYNDDRISGYGNMIVIKHPSGFSTVYAHCYKNLVKKGEHVKKGQKIALMGRSGHATGVHLHFEVRDKDGYSKDPLKYFKK